MKRISMWSSMAGVAMLAAIGVALTTAPVTALANDRGSIDAVNACSNNGRQGNTSYQGYSHHRRGMSNRAYNRQGSRGDRGWRNGDRRWKDSGGQGRDQRSWNDSRTQGRDDRRQGRGGRGLGSQWNGGSGRYSKDSGNDDRRNSSGEENGND